MALPSLGSCERHSARLDSWEQVANKAVRKEGRMFRADLTEPGVLNHA